MPAGTRSTATSRWPSLAAACVPGSDARREASGEIARRSMTSAVIFDMDGVLVDSGAHHRAAWTAMLGEIGIPVPPEFWRLTIGRPADEAVPHLVGRPLAPTEVWRLARRKHEHYVKLSRAGLPAVAGAPAFVNALARLGVPRAVATSARRADATR